MKIHPNWSKIGRPATEEANRESRALKKIWATRKIIIVEIHRLARLAVASSTDSGASSTESDIDLTTETMLLLMLKRHFGLGVMHLGRAPPAHAL